MKQEDGDSLERQTRLVNAYVEKHGLDLDTALTFHDAGVSGWKLKNVQQGALGAFIAAVEKGDISSDSTLIVENLDRITRAKPRKAMKLFEEIIDLGVTVVTLDPEQTYTAEKLDTDGGMSLMTLLMGFIRGNSESNFKSNRVSSAWADKWKVYDATGKIPTGTCPAWLQIAPDRRSWIVIEDKADVMRRIFQLSLEGHGTPTIAKMLNAEKIPAMKSGRGWSFGTVNALLKNEAVIGTWISDTHGTRREKYYPAIVEETRYYLARDAMLKRHRSGRGVVAGGHVDNLFVHMSYCSACGARIRSVGTNITRHDDGGGTRNVYVRCSAASVNNGCTAGRFPMRAVEKAVLLCVTQALVDSLDRASHPGRVDPRVVLRANIAAERQKQEKLMGAIELLDDPAPVVGRLNEVSRKIADLGAQLAAAVPPMTAADESEFVNLIRRVQGEWHMGNDVRKRVQVELRRLISRVEFDSGDMSVTVRFTDAYRDTLPKSEEGLTPSSATLLIEPHLEPVGGNRRKAA